MLVDLVSTYRVIPVLVLNDSNWAERIGRMLVDHELPLVELTLRTPNAFHSLKKLTKVDGLEVGVGSVQTINQLEEALAIGASFAVSAGINETLLSKALELGIDYLPGVATPSEILTAIEFEIQTVKWFPAGAMGGSATLKAVAAPFPNMKFVPTGGITQNNLGEFLEIKSVLGVGGSWMFQKTDNEDLFFSTLREALTEIKRNNVKFGATVEEGLNPIG